MPELTLRSMTEDEFREYRSRAEADYADEVQRNTGIDHYAALEHAARGFKEMLPSDLQTAGHRLFLAVDPASGDRVGLLWVARQVRGRVELLWIFEIMVDEPFRGRGYGRRLMELVEDQARDMGVSRVELNVFADNERARSLYDSFGYQEMSRQLYKQLDASSEA